jgi:hypothetical protein
MVRLFASLLIALGLAFAPAMMARVSAAPAGHQAAMAADHCKDAPPASDDSKADAKPCCTTACPMTADLPSEPSLRQQSVTQMLSTASAPPVFAGLDPEHETPPPRPLPAI